MLNHGIWRSPVEEALQTASLPYLTALLDVPGPWDAEHVSESMLAALAATLEADAWTGQLANISYRRLIVQDALFLHRHRGTPAALERFAERAGFVIRWVLNRRGTPARNRSIDVYITPSVFQEADAVWVDYVTAVLTRLVPYWITIEFVSVVPAIQGTLNSGGVMKMRDFLSLN